jgi:hypothetical protein
MTDEEVIQEFIKVYKDVDQVRFYVRMIDWEGPHTPTTTIVNVSTFDGEMDEAAVRAEVLRISRNRKYFRRCKECSELKPVGWMHDSKICQSCAERNHDVVY